MLQLLLHAFELSFLRCNLLVLCRLLVFVVFLKVIGLASFFLLCIVHFLDPRVEVIYLELE